MLSDVLGCEGGILVNKMQLYASHNDKGLSMLIGEPYFLSCPTFLLICDCEF